MRAPLGSSTDRQTGTDQSRSYAKARLAVHHRSACSGLKACPWLEQGALRNTSGAEAASRQALLPFFGPLTPSARSANLIPGGGTKNGLTRSEQKTSAQPKTTA